MTNNRVIGVKKSQFTGGTSISGSATFDYVDSGQNIKITFTDLLTNLGVTGTLEQGGDPLAAPVLDVQGSVNVIRNIEAGFGIAASISGQNGLTIATDFSFDETGVALVDDVSAEAPAFKSLVAGSGVTITGATGTATIALDGAAPAANQITINSLSDFAVQDATTITLEDGKVYVQGATVQTSKRFIVGKDVAVVSGNPSQSVLWDYTGTGDMFTGVDVDFFNGSGMSFRGENSAQFFNLSDTVPRTSIFNLTLCVAYPKDDVSVAGNKWGTFTDLATVLIQDSSSARGLGVNDGITLGGTQLGILSLSKFALLSTNATYIGVDLGNVVVATACEIMDMANIGLTADSIGIKGLPNSGNIAPAIRGIVRDCEFIGPITSLDGVSRSDVRFDFNNCAPVKDSRNAADMFLVGGSETIITGSAGDWQEIGVPAAVGVSWDSDIAERFTIGADGVMTYTGENDISERVSGRATVAKVGGGANILEVRLAKNWNGLASDSGLEKSRAQTENAAPTTVPFGALVELTNGDNLRPIFSNITGTSNIVANVSAMEVSD